MRDGWCCRRCSTQAESIPAFLGKGITISWHVMVTGIEHGKQVPQDYSVVAFSDHTELLMDLRPS